MRKIALLLSLISAYSSFAVIGDYLDSKTIPDTICYMEMEYDRKGEEFAYCSAILINESTLLTAAHCFSKKTHKIKVNCRKEIGSTKEETQTVSADSISIHPYFAKYQVDEKIRLEENEKRILEDAERKYKAKKKEIEKARDEIDRRRDADEITKEEKKALKKEQKQIKKDNTEEVFIKREKAKYKSLNFVKNMIASDLAVVNLKKPMKRNNYMSILTDINKIKMLISKGHCLLMGAGKIDKNLYSEGWNGAGELRVAKSPSVISYDESKYLLGVKGKNALRGGDSGGAFVCKDKGTYKLVGINKSAKDLGDGKYLSNFSIFTSEQNKDWLGL